MWPESRTLAFRNERLPLCGGEVAVIAGKEHDCHIWNLLSVSKANPPTCHQGHPDELVRTLADGQGSGLGQGPPGVHMVGQPLDSGSSPSLKGEGCL